MTTLSLQGVRLSWAGSTIGPISANYPGSRVLLFGDWTWLRAVLSGKQALAEGTIQCLDQDARTAVEQGRVGVSLADIDPPPEWELQRWLTLNLDLLGVRHAEARKRATTTLTGLGLQGLADRRISDLNAAEAFAAHAAFAACTEPEVLILGAPLLLPETRTFELQLIERLAQRHRLLLSCNRRDETLWDLADEFAYSRPNGSGPTHLPLELMASGANRFRLRPLIPSDELWTSLVQRGATLDAPGADGARLVSLPNGSGPGLIVEAANQCGAALAELVSESEAR